MTKSHWIRIACVAVAALVVLRLGLVYDELPTEVASHFDFSGRANSHQGKLGFVVSMALLQLLIPVPLLVMTSSLHRAPLTSINIPNRDYWLSPERRESSLRRVASLLDEVNLAIALLLASVAELMIRAQLAVGPRPLRFAIPLVLFLVFTLFWSLRLHRQFRLPASSERS